jgi:hypothetical protein
MPRNTTGKEKVNPVPMEVHVKHERTLSDEIAEIIARQIHAQTAPELETPEEFEDFEMEDELDPIDSTKYVVEEMTEEFYQPPQETSDSERPQAVQPSGRKPEGSEQSNAPDAPKESPAAESA